MFLKLNIPFGVSDDTKVKIKEKKDIILEKKKKKKEAKKKAKDLEVLGEDREKAASSRKSSAARQKSRSRKGRRSTILTDNLGSVGGEENQGKKTLLGL